MFHTNPDTALGFSSNPPKGISVERRQKIVFVIWNTQHGKKKKGEKRKNSDAKREKGKVANSFNKENLF